MQLKRLAGGVVMTGAMLAGTVLHAGQYAAKPAANAPTFTKDVAPILYKNCTSCHRPGEIAPMSLLTYKEARPWAKSIRQQVSFGQMPPWHADPAHGTFLNDRRLSEADKATLIKWASAGAPEGSPADLPPLPKYAEGWSMGEPDAVLSMNEDYKLPADGTIDYKYFTVPTGFTEDKWLQGIEVRPGSRSAVHHVIVFLQEPKTPGAPRPPALRFGANMAQPKADVEAEKVREASNDRPSPGELNRYIGGYVPGQAVRVYQPGTAIRVPAGSSLVFQMHYTATGTASTDRTRIGLRFAKEPVTTEVRVTALQNRNFTLKAGEREARVDAEMTMLQDVTLWSMLPHTHVRGKRWEYTATYPDGRTETILAVPNYDFNWQTEYVFKTPLKLPKGTKVHSTAWYDNSANNPFNPDPSIDVRWGDQTWEEMQFTGFNYSVDSAVTATAEKPQR